ncbi:MAG TPA: hypothetical protein VFE30_13520 [Anaeromyxobacteraceae bacterium]|nr:hypothetical protein [Anaeromyxobacteraceae bacterium]
MVQRLAALLLLLPSLALADTAGTVTVSESNDSDNQISIAECNGSTADTLSFSWTVSTSSTIPSGNSFEFRVSDTSGCPLSSTTTTANTASITTIASNGSASGTYSGQAVSSLLHHSGLTFSCSVPATVFVCALITDGAGATASAVGTIALDAAIPPAPVVNTPSPGDNALNVSWTNGTTVADGGTVGTAASYEVFVAPHGAAFPANPSVTVTSPSTSVRVGGLTNGALYDVVVYALSTGGNVSAASNIVSGTPIQVDDFWKSYKDAGGKETGGCSHGSAGAIALVLAPLLLLARKRRRS